MKKIIKHIGIMLVALIGLSVNASAQFDDVYFDPSRDLYNVSNTNSYANANHNQRRGETRAAADQSYNYAQNDQYAYDDDEYDYYNESYNDNYYFDDYAYARRINRFHRNRFFYDPFLYDDMYMMGMMSGMMYGSMYSPYRFAGIYSPFYRPGLHFSIGFGMPYFGMGFNSFYGMGYPSYYNRFYSPFYSPYSMFYDPIMAYNYGGYGYGYPYVYRNNVNHGEMPQYYRGARTSGAAGVVPVARDGRTVQTRSSGNQNTGEYVAPTTRTSPRSEDRSNRAGSVRSSGENQNLSPRSSGETPTRTSPRSNTYTPSSEARTDRVYRSPGTVERVGSGDRSTYTPRTQSTRSTTPSATSPRSTYTPNRGTSSRTYTPSSRNSSRATTPTRSNTSINRSAPTRSAAPAPRSTSSSGSRSSGSSSGRTSPR